MGPIDREQNAPAPTAMQDALCWAAGSPRANFDIPSEHYDQFLRNVKAHRITGRLVRRLRELDSVDGDFQRLLKLAEADHQLIVAEVRAQIEMSVSLHSLVAARVPELDKTILLKGCTLFALTRDELDMRLSGDVDIVTSHPEVFVDCAVNAGARIAGELNTLAEYAVLETPDHRWVEVHSRFDITGSTGRTCSARDSPGAWFNTGYFTVEYLLEDEMRRNLASAHGLPEGLVVLNPELSALVYAAHTYKDFMRFPFPLRVATARLDELATIRDLCLREDFRWDQFDSLAERLSGREATDFAFMIIREVLGTELPSTSVPNFDSFPKNLWWDGVQDGGIPVGVRWSAWDLICREERMEEFAQELVPNLWHVNRSRARTFQPLPPDGRVRTIWNQSDSSSACVTIAINGSLEDGLNIVADFSGIAEESLVGASFYFQDHRYEVLVRSADNWSYADYSHRGLAEDVTVQCERTSTVARIVLRMGRDATVESLGTAGRLDGFLVVREQELPWGAVQARAAVPVCLALA